MLDADLSCSSFSCCMCLCYGVSVVLFNLLYVLSMPVRLEDAPCAIPMPLAPVKVATFPVGALPSPFLPLSLDRVLPQRLSFDIFFHFPRVTAAEFFCQVDQEGVGRVEWGRCLHRSVHWTADGLFDWVSGGVGRGDGSGRRSSRSARCDAQRLCSLLFHIWCEIQ